MYVLSDVILQYAHESNHLWMMRMQALAYYYACDFIELDHRIDAHLDGLRIAGEEGWKLCCKELAWEEAGEIFTAGVLAFESGEQDRINEVVKVVIEKPLVAAGMISAMGWLEFPKVEIYARKFASSQQPSLQRIGIGAFAVHRQDPGELLAKALNSEDMPLRSRALRAVGELGRTDLIYPIQRELGSPDESCRFWAAWSNALLSGGSEALRVLQRFILVSGSYRERAVKILFRRLDIGSGHEWQQQLAGNTESMRMAVLAAGVIGDPGLIPWLIEQMKVPILARVAGEAFTMITGVDLAYEDLNCNKPEGFESGPTEDPADDNVEMDPDEKLPWPDSALITSWWDKHENEFQSGTRYLLGKPITIDWMRSVLRIGTQRQRAAAAMELAMLQPGEPLFEVRAPGFRQQQLLNWYK